MKKEDIVLVCMKIADLPIPPAPEAIGHCDECQERIWVGLKSPKKHRAICAACMKAEGGKPKMMVTERSLALAMDYLRRKGQIV